MLAGRRTASMIVVTPYTAENNAPTKGLKHVERPRPTPIVQMAPFDAGAPVRAATNNATSPAAQENVCCGLYQRPLGKPSMRSPLNCHAVMASIFVSSSDASDPPERQICCST